MTKQQVNRPRQHGRHRQSKTRRTAWRLFAAKVLEPLARRIRTIDNNARGSDVPMKVGDDE